jgi:hypothetical protein
VTTVPMSAASRETPMLVHSGCRPFCTSNR